MKKVMYSIGLVSAVLLSACSSDNNRGTTAEVSDANTTETTDTGMTGDFNRSETAEMAGSAGTTTGTAMDDATKDASYQQHAQMISDQMARDLKLDDKTATEVTRIYYERNRQIGQMEQGTNFSATERMGGRTNETTGNTTGTAQDNTRTSKSNTSARDTDVTGIGTQPKTTTNRATIDKTTDSELKAVLTPQQYRQYEQNRNKYNTMQLNNTDMNRTKPAGTNNNMNNQNNQLNNNQNNNNLNNNTDRNNNGTGTQTDRPTGGN